MRRRECGKVDRGNPVEKAFMVEQANCVARNKATQRVPYYGEPGDLVAIASKFFQGILDFSGNAFSPDLNTCARIRTCSNVAKNWSCVALWRKGHPKNTLTDCSAVKIWKADATHRRMSGSPNFCDRPKPRADHRSSDHEEPPRQIADARDFPKARGQGQLDVELFEELIARTF